MPDNASLMLAIIGAVITWTASVISLVVWLTGKFRFLEQTIYREMDKHQREDNRHFGALDLAVQRLEIRTFGVTKAPISEEL